VVQGRGNWQAFANAAMNLWVPKKYGNFVDKLRN